MELFGTRRFLVRLWRDDDDDVDACFAIYRDEDVSRWLERPPFHSRSQAREANLRQLDHQARHPGLGWWPIVNRADAEIVGQAALMPIPDAPDDLELGYHVARPWWGRGVATEVARGVLDYAAQHFPARRVIAVTRPHNAASRRVMEKIGLRFAGETVFKGLHSVEYVAGPPTE
ncbi:MAG: GNAT family N-acetyltransferase [Myxococcota bacterium]